METGSEAPTNQRNTELRSDAMGDVPEEETEIKHLSCTNNSNEIQEEHSQTTETVVIEKGNEKSEKIEEIEMTENVKIINKNVETKPSEDDNTTEVIKDTIVPTLNPPTISSIANEKIVEIENDTRTGEKNHSVVLTSKQPTNKDTVDLIENDEVNKNKTDEEEKEEEIEEEEEEEEGEDEEEEEEEVVDGDEEIKEKSNDTPDMKMELKNQLGESAQQQQVQLKEKQDSISTTIKEIISDIDSSIKNEENLAVLKQKEMEMLEKQKELAQEIQQQQLLAKKLAEENKMQQQHLEQQRLLQEEYNYHQQHQQQLQQTRQQINQNISKEEEKQENESKVLKHEENANRNGFTQENETNEFKSSNVPKGIDLNKIFTPATDAEEILPKNRKLYASSAFYSSTLHPTVEDQVELARRISHSLSDKSNLTSKGQSMYVNRKKRSVKWVHEGCGKGKTDVSSEDQEYEEEYKENTDSLNEKSVSTERQTLLNKVPLRFLMNPRGQLRDFNSVRESLNTETGLLSPNSCAELVSALQTQKGRGAELFAKRRRKADKWVIDETNAGIQSPSGLPDYHQYQPKPPTSPSILPAYSDAGKHRVQLNMHQEKVLEKYAKPGLKVVKTPWEAALETGSASTAFVEQQKLSSHENSSISLSPSITNSGIDVGAKIYDYTTSENKQANSFYHAPKPLNPQRDLAYKPSLAQGWKAPSVSLPRELYVPDEIPLESYAPPPVTPVKRDIKFNLASSVYPHTEINECITSPLKGGSVPLSKPFGATSYVFSTAQPPKQPMSASDSYQTVPQNTSQVLPQVNFNPSPLPYEKLSKFENPSPELNQNLGYPGFIQQPTHLRVPGPKACNISLTPFGNNAGSTATQKFSPRTYDPYPTPHQFSNVNSNFNATTLKNSHNFNNLARGWRPSSSITSNSTTSIGQRSYVNTVPVGSTTQNMPFTDF